MRCAAFTVTPHGQKMAMQLAAESDFGTVDVFVKEGKKTVSGETKSYQRLADAVDASFQRYDALIFFTAIGIAVRLIASHLRSKLTDPAVLVIDDRSSYVISLLSGHVGGGNLLAENVAEILDAQPIVTTATDVNNKVAPDVIAAELGLRPHPKSMISMVNSQILTGRPIACFVDANMTRADFYVDGFRRNGYEPRLVSITEAVEHNEPAVLVTTRRLPRQEHLLYLLPRRLVAGIGCRRGVPREKLKAALASACAMIGQDISAVSMIASTVVKADEQGILELAEELNVSACFFSNEEMQAKIDEYDLQQSDFVRAKIGIGNVSGAAALCAVDKGRFALEKTKFEKVTVALVWEK